MEMLRCACSDCVGAFSLGVCPGITSPFDRWARARFKSGRLSRTQLRKGPPIVIAKAVVVATPIAPLASDLPFIPEPISLFLSHLAGGRLIGCNYCKRGLDGLSRIWVFQIGWNGIFLAGALLGGRKPPRCNVNTSSRWSRPSACAAMAPSAACSPPTTDDVWGPKRVECSSRFSPNSMNALQRPTVTELA